MLTAAVTGFVTGFALIFAIGAQNAFVLRQGLLRQHVFAVCLICALSDAVLIALGVAGIGGLAHAAPWAVPALTWGGIVFLSVYGVFSLRRAFRPDVLRPAAKGTGSLRLTAITCLALTWLNPHVYLDTVGVIGVVSTGFNGLEDKFAYGAGAVLSSFVFFFGLGYGARLLETFFARPRAWAALDIVIAFVMWGIAANLLLSPHVA